MRSSWRQGGRHDGQGLRPARFPENGGRGRRGGSGHRNRHPAPSAQAQQPAAQPAAEGYEFLNLDEAAFVEALVDHMVPADQLTPKGTEIGINIYIDRALGGAWGKGERLYMQGPWQVGLPTQFFSRQFGTRIVAADAKRQTQSQCHLQDDVSGKDIGHADTPDHAVSQHPAKRTGHATERKRSRRGSKHCQDTRQFRRAARRLRLPRARI